jgi:hypothetical protein
MCPTEFCGCDPEVPYRCAHHAREYYGPGPNPIVREYSTKSCSQGPTPYQEEAVAGKEYLGKNNARKTYPVATGVLDYFPLAIMEIAHVSWAGNQQHHPDKPLHWDRSKSSDEADALLRHFLARGTPDTDGIRHTAKVAWRALALLQKELEQEGK